MTHLNPMYEALLHADIRTAAPTQGKIDQMAKALMLAFQGGYDVDENASPEVRAYYMRYREKAVAVIASLRQRVPPPPTQGAEEIVARLERELDLRGEATLLAAQFRALLASWRERGKALEQMRAYQAQLEERAAALRQRADEATRVENEACAKILDEYEERYIQKPESYTMGNIAAAIRARIAP